MGDSGSHELKQKQAETRLHTAEELDGVKAKAVEDSSSSNRKMEVGGARKERMSCGGAATAPNNGEKRYPPSWPTVLKGAKNTHPRTLQSRKRRKKIHSAHRGNFANVKYQR